MDINLISSNGLLILAIYNTIESFYRGLERSEKFLSINRLGTYPSLLLPMQDFNVFFFIYCHQYHKIIDLCMYKKRLINILLELIDSQFI